MPEEPKFTAGFAASEDFSETKIANALDKTNTKGLVGEDYYRGFKAGLLFAFIDESAETYGASLEMFILNSAANYFNKKYHYIVDAAVLSTFNVKEKLDKAFASKDPDQIIATAEEVLDHILFPLKGDGDER